MKALWLSRYFKIGSGWSKWCIEREVEVISITDTAYKIGYKN